MQLSGNAPPILGGLLSNHSMRAAERVSIRHSRRSRCYVYEWTFRKPDIGKEGSHPKVTTQIKCTITYT